MPTNQPRRSHLRVVLFSGGRGSGALSLQLVANPQIALTIAINGYDDGASTGEVRRFLGDCLGPSDFRKNASRLARALGTAPAPLIDLLDLRLEADPNDRAMASKLTAAVAGEQPFDPRLGKAVGFATSLSQAVRSAVAVRLQRFAQELAASGATFDFSDCSVGNLVFAGGFLLAERQFRHGSR